MCSEQRTPSVQRSLQPEPKVMSETSSVRHWLTKRCLIQSHDEDVNEDADRLGLMFGDSRTHFKK